MFDLLDSLLTKFFVVDNIELIMDGDQPSGLVITVMFGGEHERRIETRDVQGIICETGDRGD